MIAIGTIFGYANDAAATSGPQRSVSLQELSFTVSQGSSITDVRQLLQKFIPSGGNPSAYFVVDACIWGLNAGTCSSTGLSVLRTSRNPVLSRSLRRASSRWDFCAGNGLSDRTPGIRRASVERLAETHPRCVPRTGRARPALRQQSEIRN